MQLRPLLESDWPAVRAIYLAGLESQLPSYPPRFTDWRSWDRGHRPSLRLVAEDGGEVIGWAALTGVPDTGAEVNVYVAPAEQGRGVGGALLRALVEAADAEGLSVIRASVFRRNEASIRLHARQGFRPVGVTEPEPGLADRWLETVLLERYRPTGPRTGSNR